MSLTSRLLTAQLARRRPALPPGPRPLGVALPRRTPGRPARPPALRDDLAAAMHRRLESDLPTFPARWAAARAHRSLAAPATTGAPPALPRRRGGGSAAGSGTSTGTVTSARVAGPPPTDTRSPSLPPCSWCGAPTRLLSIDLVLDRYDSECTACGLRRTRSTAPLPQRRPLAAAVTPLPQRQPSRP